MDSKTLIKQYIGIVQKIARVEHRRIPNHMIEYEELVSIGIIAIQTLIKDKTEEQELTEDLIQIITVFSCKLQGRRKSKTKALVNDFYKKIKETNE